MLPDKVDVLVIGAGVLGTATAYYLASRGVQALVVDKGETAGGASGTNLGQISLVDREAGPELDLAFQSLTAYTDLEKEWRCSLGFKRAGGLYLLDHDDDLSKIEEILKQKQAYLDCSLLTGQEINKQEPFLDANKVTGAVYCPDEGKLDPFQVTLGFMDGAQAKGASLATKTAVTGFEVEGNRIVAVKTSAGPIKVTEVVLASGAWTYELATFLGLDLPVYYHRGAAMVTQPIPPTINGPIVPGKFLTGSIDHNGSVFVGTVQHENGSVIIAQANDKVQNYDVNVTYRGITKMAQLFLEYFPKLNYANIIRAWAGVTTYVEDGLPFFGYSKKIQNLFLVAGFKGAFTVAPAVGRMAAEVICTGQSTIDGSTFSPKRYNQ